MRIILHVLLYILVPLVSLVSCVQDKLDLSENVSLDTEIGGVSLAIPLGDGKPTYISSVIDFDELQSKKEEIQAKIDEAALYGITIDLTTIEYDIPAVHEYAKIIPDDLDQIQSVDWKITTDFINTVPSGLTINVKPLDADNNVIDSKKINITVTPNHIDAGDGVNNPVTTSIVITLVANDGALKNLVNLDFEAKVDITNVDQAFKLEENQYVQFTKMVIYNNKPMSFDFN